MEYKCALGTVSFIDKELLMSYYAEGYHAKCIDGASMAYSVNISRQLLVILSLH